MYMYMYVYLMYSDYATAGASTYCCLVSLVELIRIIVETSTAEAGVTLRVFGQCRRVKRLSVRLAATICMESTDYKTTMSL